MYNYYVEVYFLRQTKKDRAMLFSRKELTFIIFPLLIEQLLSVTVGMFDSMMVASLGEAAVSGVSLVASVNLLLNVIFTALATGGSVVCSQLLGRKDYKEAKDTAKQLCYLALITSAVIMALALVLRKPLLSAFFGKVDADVMANAKEYFLITALCYPFIALNCSCSAIFRAIGNTKTVLYVSFGINSVNIVGNAILIYFFHLGVDGAAIATLVSTAIGTVVNMVLSCNPKSLIYLEKIFNYRPSFPIIRRILRIGVPSSIETGMFQFGKLLMQSIVSSLGTASIAANVAGGQLTSLEDALGSAMGLAMITVVGRCIGAGEEKQAKAYAKKLVCVGYAVLTFMALLLTLLAKPLIGLYNLSDEAGGLAFGLVLLYNLMTAVFWTPAFILPYVFRAASDVRYTTGVSMLTMWLCRVALGYILVLWFDLGLLGVWLGMFADWIARTVFFTVRFFSGRWLTKYKST